MSESNKRINDSFTKALERGGIVIDAAKLIDPDAFAPWNWMRSEGGGYYQPMPEPADRGYRRAQAVCRAIDVLKLAAGTGDLQAALVEHEMAGSGRRRARCSADRRTKIRH